MPRKLTVVGVLAALVLGVVGLQLTPSARATPVQTFCSASTAAFSTTINEVALATTINQVGGMFGPASTTIDQFNGITATDTSVTVVSTAGTQATGTLTIDIEQITYSGKTATSFTGLGRGANATTAAAHDDVSPVSVSDDTSVTVVSTAGFAPADVIKIGAEKIFYSGKTATSFTGLGRGAFSTTAAAHVDGAAVVPRMTATDTSVPVVSTAGMPSTGVIKIDAEQMTYTGKTATSFTVLGRGAFGTTAAAHADTSSVFGAPRGGCIGGLQSVHSVYCFDTGGGVMPSGPIPPSGVIPCGANTSATAIPAGTGVPIRIWQIIMIPFGARQTLPAYYLPYPWTYAAAAPGATTGNVSANTDLLCDGSIDILSPTQEPAPFGDTTTWPGNGWGTGYDVIRQNVASASTPGVPDVTTLSINGYVDSIKPMPATFVNVSLDRSNLLKLWIGGVVYIDIPPTAADGVNAQNQGAPLQRLVTASPYLPGLSVSIALLAGDPAPPAQSPWFLCLDSPQNSVAENDLIIPPSTPGNYVRWTALESAADTIDGSVARILDVQCVNVGGAAGTCDMSDADGDLVPAAVEAVNGTNTFLADSDADGATDYDEIFQFSDPNVADTDGDGSMDKQDDLAGFNCVSVAGVCTVANLGDTIADDNCPVDANASQDNTDSQPDFTNSPNTPAGAIYRGDATNPHQDHQGDACDTDADNDGLNNVTEAGFQHPTLSPGAGGGPAAGTLYCLHLSAAAAAGGSSTVTTSPLNPDSDSDGGLDGRECLFGSDPNNAAAGSCQPTCAGTNRFPAAVGDTDGDQLAGTVLGVNDAAELFYRTRQINLPGGGTLNDLEQPGSYGALIPDGLIGNGDPDADGDRINDGVEVKWYGTSPANFDTDGDGCSDGREAADINGNHTVNSTDLLAVAQHSASGSLAPGKVGVPLPLGSPAPAYFVAGVRRGDLATYDVNKDGKIDSTDLLLVAKLSGNCAAGTGAQTAQPIIRAANP